MNSSQSPISETATAPHSRPTIPRSPDLAPPVMPRRRVSWDARIAKGEQAYPGRLGVGGRALAVIAMNGRTSRSICCASWTSSDAVTLSA